MAFQTQLRWVSESNGRVPSFAVEGGIDGNHLIYVIRTNHQGAIVPGKLHASHAYIPYDTKEISVSNYEVLVAPSSALSWVESSGSNIPPHAVVGGRENGSERLYIGRVIHNKTVTVGKVHPSHGVCYFPYDGNELSKISYEILVVNAYGRLLGINPN